MPDLTSQQLAKAVSDMAKNSARNMDAIQAAAQWITSEGDDTRRIAEQIGAMRVDAPTIAETKEVAHVMQGLAAAAYDYAATAGETSKRASAAHEANRKSHDGIGEAMHRSPVGAAIFDVKRGWLSQE